MLTRPGLSLHARRRAKGEFDDIIALPVASWAADDAALLLWTTKPMLPRALEVIVAWGFTYKTIGFIWAKTTAAGDRFPIGMGFWTRVNPELCLLATRGAPSASRPRSLNSSSLPAESTAESRTKLTGASKLFSTVRIWRCSRAIADRGGILWGDEVLADGRDR